MNPEYNADTVTLPRLFSGKRFGLLTFAALELWMWFGMAGLNYERGSLFPFTTAGWFILSQIFVIPFFGLLAWVTTLFFKRWPKVVGLLVLGGLAFLNGTAIHDALPRERLNWLIGPDIIRHAEIESLRVTDSFNDGETYNGILLIGAEFMAALGASPLFELVKRHPDEHVRPEAAGTIYRSKRAELRVVPDGSRCFFKSFFPYTPPKQL